jgi:hypothetical protein
MSVANPLRGAPRIHGELLKLGMDVGQTTVAKSLAQKTTTAVAGLEDLCSKSRRRHRSTCLWCRRTRLGFCMDFSWLAAQLTEACGWDEPPRYLIRDCDGAFPGHGHSRPAGLGAVALAERVRGEAG